MFKFLITYMSILLLCSVVFAKGNRWQIFDKMPMPVAGAEVVTFDDKVYIFGGYQQINGAPVSTIQEYNPSACLEKRWRVVGEMKIPRSNFVARLFNDTVYILGGTTGHKRENVASMETWSLATMSGTLLHEDPVLNRTGATAEIWNDFLIVIGGYNNSRPEYHLGFFAAFNLSLDQNVGQLPIPTNQDAYNLASIQVNDVIYLFGGVRFGVSDRIYKIDMNELDWVQRPPIFTGKLVERIYPDLPIPRSAMRAIQTDADTVYLVGGYNEGSAALETVSKFVIGNYGYEHISGPPLQEARKELVTAQLDTVLYAFGGLNEHDEVLETVEALIDTFVVDSCETSVADRRELTLPSTMHLRQNYPNPFNSATTIEFEIGLSAHIQLDIYSLEGRHIASLIDDKLAAGMHRHTWHGKTNNGEMAPSGVYIYRLSSEQEIRTRKMLLVK